MFLWGPLLSRTLEEDIVHGQLSDEAFAAAGVSDLSTTIINLFSEEQTISLGSFIWPTYPALASFLKSRGPDPATILMTVPDSPVKYTYSLRMET